MYRKCGCSSKSLRHPLENWIPTRRRKMSNLGSRILLVVMLCAGRSALFAQAKYTSTATACLSSFYDAKMYHWLSYANNCTDRVNVTWVARNAKNGGALEIRSGGSANTGFSEREIDEMGGTEAYACPDHYMPVDTNDRNITKPVSSFRCKYRGY